MAYAKTIPPFVIKICRWFNIFCLLLSSIICVDVFILPRAIDIEKVISIEESYVTYRNVIYSRVTRPLDNIVLITDNFRVPFRGSAIAYLEQAESIQIISTPLLNIIEKVTVRVPSYDKELNQKSGIFGKLMFVPILFAIISIWGVVARNNNEQLLNAFVMNIIMFIILVVLVSYF
jgi:hypothetical protein